MDSRRPRRGKVERGSRVRAAKRAAPSPNPVVLWSFVGVLAVVVGALLFSVLRGKSTSSNERSSPSDRVGDRASSNSSRDFLAEMVATEVELPVKGRSETAEPEDDNRPVVGYDDQPESIALNLSGHDEPLPDTIELDVEGTDFPALGPVEERIATLEVVGDAGGGPDLTRSQIGFALQQMNPPYFLLNRSGKVTTYTKDGRDPSTLNHPSGPPGKPKLHLIVDVQAMAGSNLRFYGKSLGKNTGCIVNVQIQKVGERNETIDSFTESEKVTELSTGLLKKRKRSPAASVQYFAVERAAKRLVSRSALR